MADHRERAAVLVSVRGWVDVDLAPPTVVADLVDADGEEWLFEVADDLVWDERPPWDADFPRPGRLGCTIVKDEMVAGILQVLIDTDVTSVDGVSRFRVLRALVP